MVSISLSEGAIRHVGRSGHGAGIVVYRDILRNGAFLPKAMIGKEQPGSGLFILADNRSVPVWVEKAFFSQLEEDSSVVSLSLDRGLVKRLRIEVVVQPAAGNQAGCYLAV